MAKLVSSRYSLALFEVGLELDKIEDFHRDLDFLAKTFENEPKLADILNHPKIGKDEKRSLIDKIFGKMLNLEVINFIYILIDKRREENIISIVKEYEKLLDAHKNRVNVKATTAIPMDDVATQNLINNLKKSLGKDINLTNVVDKKVLGGVLLEMNDALVDGTVRGQLEAMKKTLV